MTALPPLLESINAAMHVAYGRKSFSGRLGACLPPKVHLTTRRLHFRFSGGRRFAFQSVTASRGRTASMSESVLQNAALASGLLARQQLDDALAGLVNSAPGAAQTVAEVLDEELGRRLVELGYLNRWQVEQLKEGRTKFTLGPYRIVNAIGQGGMGHVFKAEHKMLGRTEAVKVLPKNRSTPEAIAAFQREIRAQAQLDHPNLVRATYADH